MSADTNGRMSDFLRYEVDEEVSVATITMTNPPMNVAPWTVEHDFLQLIDEWEEDDRVKVVIIRGAGEHFCAGHDFGSYRSTMGMKDFDPAAADAPSEPAESTGRTRPSNREQWMRSRYDNSMRLRLFNSAKPTIAEVRGLCIEWANGIQACCDMTIAAEDAQLGNLGQTAGLSGIGPLQLYAQLIGFKRAREMAISGRTFSGHDAALIGLVNRAVPADQLQAAVWEEACRIALIPLDGLVTGKAYANMVFGSMGLDQAFKEASFGFTLGLKIRVEEDEFGFLREVGRSGAASAIAQRQARYEPLGGFGKRGSKPIVPR